MIFITLIAPIFEFCVFLSGGWTFSSRTSKKSEIGNSLFHPKHHPWELWCHYTGIVPEVYLLSIHWMKLLKNKGLPFQKIC
jgi:hypothetical protein